jgi:hypothetical protein
MKQLNGLSTLRADTEPPEPRRPRGLFGSFWAPSLVHTLLTPYRTLA